MTTTTSHSRDDQRETSPRVSEPPQGAQSTKSNGAPPVAPSKPPTWTPRQLMIIALCIVAIVAALMSYRGQSEREQGLLTELSAVGTVLTANALLDKELDKASGHHADNYDGIAYAEDMVRRALPTLKALPNTRAKYEALETALKQKLYGLDQVKIALAIESNSSRYFPKAFAASTARGKAEEIKTKLLVVRTRLEHEPNHPRYREDLKELIAAAEATEDEDLIRVALHTEAIAESAKVLSAHPPTFFEGLLGPELEAIRNDVDAIAQDAVFRQNVSIGIAVVAALALFATLALTLRKLFVMRGSAERIIPQAVLDALGAKSIDSLKAGDAVERCMNVMFIDLRGFTTRSEKQTAKESFEFLNEYIIALRKPIEAHQGFVVEQRGDGVFALFNDDNADGAVKAGLACIDAISALAKERNTPLKIGIGVNAGDVMIGMYGDKDRMSVGVSGTTVNVASRVEALTKKYEVSFLINESVKQRLHQPDQIALRSVDQVVVNGMSGVLYLHEVFDRDPNDVRAMKLSVRAKHERAMALYFKGEFHDALKLFEPIAEDFSSDVVTAKLVNRCKDLLVKEPAWGAWDGAWRVDPKA